MKRSAFKYIVLSGLILSLSLGLTSFEGEDIVSTETISIDHDSFDQVMKVVTHKRCMNCHPSGDIPRQGEDSHLHYLGVQRGVGGNGLAGYTCNTCHQSENNNFAGVPGAPHWALAPASMAWEGKSRVEIAKQIMDPARNGGRSTNEILKHLTEDELVLWAWKPGVNGEGEARELPPLGKEEWIAAVKDWIANGAVIPDK
jgi:hypothetical protein